MFVAAPLPSISLTNSTVVFRTGPAALAACAGVPGIEIFCLYPKGRISRVQELQLTTAEGDAPNIHVFRTDGNTDEQAEVLKTVFGDHDFVAKNGVCSVNSINVARVITQSSYYVFSYLQVGICKLRDPHFP